MSKLEQAQQELARLKGYQTREKRVFGRIGTWDEPVDRASAEVNRLLNPPKDST